ncbi:hypothetical protein V5T82_14070 [Magnetovibrio sp. PR-2]|uniref:hypothetical protein n=1 Tax=Magnetovibrio sp. PR-2 TaxID=3120356 RepID=UPI002FCE50B3
MYKFTDRAEALAFSSVMTMFDERYGVYERIGFYSVVLGEYAEVHEEYGKRIN